MSAAHTRWTGLEQDAGAHLHWGVRGPASGCVLAGRRSSSRQCRSCQRAWGYALPSQVIERRFDLDGDLGNIQTLSVLVIGVGRSGGRFVRAFNYLRRIGLPVRLVGLCDVNPDLPETFGTPVPIFGDVRAALEAAEADVVVVCVNEAAHFEVLKAISELAPNALVLSEKPLTATLEQFDHIEQLFASDAITVNFVERYSPVVSDFNAWRERESAEILRAEFFWGKYRYRDPRPTMGVLSEISHPIDLVRALTGLPEDTPVDIREVSMSNSDFSCSDADVADTVGVVCLLGSEVLVRGHSSFLWEERRRRVILYGRRKDGSIFQAVLAFDEPRWDQDWLTIYSVDGATGTRSTVLETRYTNSDFPAELDQIYKVTRFVRESLRHLSDPTAAQNLVTMRGARWVQAVIDEIGTRASQVPNHSVAFGARG
jgi:predicted dehydrogenase